MTMSLFYLTWPRGTWTCCAECGANDFYCVGGKSKRTRVTPGHYATGGVSEATRTRQEGADEFESIGLAAKFNRKMTL